MKKRQNLEAGFTLVEMIITIAIMAILAGVAAGSMSLITAGNAKKSSARFNSALNEAQVQTMSRVKPTYLYLYRASNGRIMVATSESDAADACKTIGEITAATRKEREVGDSTITVKYTQNSTEKTLGDGEILRITYRKDSGAYDVGESGHTNDFSLAPADRKFISEVKFEGKSSYKVKMVKETGRHYVEKK